MNQATCEICDTSITPSQEGLCAECDDRLICPCGNRCGPQFGGWGGLCQECAVAIAAQNAGKGEAK